MAGKNMSITSKVILYILVNEQTPVLILSGWQLRSCSFTLQGF